MLQRVMSQIATVKKDMVILEKSEFSTLLAENEVNVFFGVVLRRKIICSIKITYCSDSVSRLLLSFSLSVVETGMTAQCVCASDFLPRNLTVSVFCPFSQKLKVQLLQLKVQLAVSDYCECINLHEFLDSI